MDLKFVEVLKRFFPTGKVWEFQDNFNYLLGGLSLEFSRVYEKGKAFYSDFNIVGSETLATEHSGDYLIRQGLYSNLELQRIIVNYMNKDIEFRAAVQDFADFLGVPITWGNIPTPIQFGETFEFPSEFGDGDFSEVMELLIEFGDGATCEGYRKIRWLVLFLKPPYLRVTFSSEPIVSIEPIEFGEFQFGGEFGELIPCEL